MSDPELLESIREDYTEEECALELLDAARYNDIDILKGILEVHPHLEKHANDQGNTCLHYAAANGHSEIVDLLERHTMKNKSGNTPLHWAALNGQKAVVELLLKEKSADVLQRNEFGKSALTEGFCTDTVEALLSHESATEEKLLQTPSPTSTDEKAQEIHDLKLKHVLLKIRELSMGSSTILGQENPEDDKTGLGIWASALVMAQWMADTATSPNKSRTVLELGAGCGIPGLVMAQQGHEVILTDFNPTVVANLEHNIQINELAKVAKAQRLNWQTDHDDMKPLDIVIGSDLIYQHDMVPTLMKTLRQLVGGTFYYCCATDAPRQGQDEFLAALAQEFDLIDKRPAPPAYSQNPLASKDDEACFLHFSELQSAEFCLYEWRKRS